MHCGFLVFEVAGNVAKSEQLNLKIEACWIPEDITILW